MTRFFVRLSTSSDVQHWHTSASGHTRFHDTHPWYEPSAEGTPGGVTPGLGTVGYVPLLGWIKQHVQQQHAPPCKGWEVCVCTGNSDGFQRAWEALLDPGDTLLVDELNFAFSTSQLAQWVGGRQLHVEPLAPQGQELPVDVLVQPHGARHAHQQRALRPQQPHQLL